MRAVLLIAALIIGILECISFAMDGWHKDYDAANVFYPANAHGGAYPYPGDGRPEFSTAFPDIVDWSTLVIELRDHGGLMGSDYSVKIHGDGTVIFEGKGEDIAFPGRHVTRLDIAEVRDLFTAFKSAEFFHLYEEYSTRWIDAPGQLLSIAFDHHKKEVYDSGGQQVNMPRVVGDLENRVSAVARTWTHGNSLTIAALREEGWDFTSDNERSRNLLITAGVSGDIAFARDVIGAGIDPRKAASVACIAAYQAARNDNSEVLALLMSHGAPVYRVSGQNDEELCDVLSAAASRGILGDVIAVQKRVPARYIERALNNAFFAAVSGTLGKDADLAQYDEVIKYLLNAGVDVNTHDSEGKNALANAGHKPNIIKTLLESGARGVNEVDKGGETPLLHTLHVDTIRLLLAAGADPYVKNRDGKTVLDEVEWHNMREATAVLRAWMETHPPEHYRKQRKERTK